jgi:hypothetical protein
MRINYNPADHVTTAERRAIQTMLSKGLTNARNAADNKRYCIESGNGNGEYTVSISTKSRMWIGEEPKWRGKRIEIYAQQRREERALTLELF